MSISCRELSLTLKDAKRGFVVHVSPCVLTVTHSTSLFRTLSLPEMASSSSSWVHVQNRVRVCVSVSTSFCLHTKDVEIWNTPTPGNKAGVETSDRQAELRKAILKQEDVNWCAFRTAETGGASYRTRLETPGSAPSVCLKTSTWVLLR